MKFLFVTTVSGTVNAFLIPHIRMLVENGHSVDVAFNINKEPDEELTNLGCRIHKVNFSRSVFKNNYPLLIKTIKNIVIAGNYDVVHTHTPIASAIVRIACKSLKNVKIIYTAHGFHFYKNASLINWSVFYPIEKYLSKFTDLIITINNEDFELARKFNTCEVQKIPGIGVDLNKFMVTSNSIEKRKSLGIDENEIVLLSIGELSNRKNHKITIEALSKLNDIPFQYIICGIGANRNELQKLIEKKNMTNKIKLVGFRKDISEIIGISNIFIFPSLQEGLPVSVMEAMCGGLPVIASDIRGNNDLIDDQKGGFLFESNNVKQLSEKIEHLYNNPNLQTKFGNYNQERVKQYSINNVLPIMKKIYSSL